ncbi:MAG: glycosyltransferase family protein [Thermoflexus sp.]|jgi:spore coat polysaccharide biosynthesis protein SpsF|nr:glycosyltransferase family protein [Thermoflexus sp.]MDT7947017.1 glycosyltransferase family protein [Thermoflexus sp.]
MKTVAIVQARMGSTRLPGKVLQDLAGEPMLARVVNRTCRAKTLQEVVIATTTNTVDDVIVKLCEARGWSWFRGSEEDVLDRYYRAAKKYQADFIVRITSDCPLIDPEVIDQVVQEFLERQPEVDYASNTWPRRTFPRGLDTEVMRMDVLERAWREDRNPAWREHVTPYIYRNPDRFRIHNVVSPVDYSAMRWTVDTQEDLAFVRQIYDYFGHDRFSWREVLKVLEEHPEWLEINRGVRQKRI